MSFAAKVKKQTDSLYLIKAKDKNGKPCFFFILADKRAIMRYEFERKKGPVNINDYGKIVYSAFGEEPSEELRKELEEKYT